MMYTRHAVPGLSFLRELHALRWHTRTSSLTTKVNVDSSTKWSSGEVAIDSFEQGGEKLALERMLQVV